MIFYFILPAKIPEFMKNADGIVGGKFAPSNIPWQAQVYAGEKSWFAQGQATHYCGATILDAKTILSAAHCFFAGPRAIQKDNIPEKYHGKKFINAMDATIRVGFTDQSNPGPTYQVMLNKALFMF